MLDDGAPLVVNHDDAQGAGSGRRGGGGEPEAGGERFGPGRSGGRGRGERSAERRGRLRIRAGDPQSRSPGRAADSCPPARSRWCFPCSASTRWRTRRSRRLSRSWRAARRPASPSRSPSRPRSGGGWRWCDRRRPPSSTTPSAIPRALEAVFESIRADSAPGAPDRVRHPGLAGRGDQPSARGHPGARDPGIGPADAPGRHRERGRRRPARPGPAGGAGGGAERTAGRRGRVQLPADAGGGGAA